MCFRIGRGVWPERVGDSCSVVAEEVFAAKRVKPRTSFKKTFCVTVEGSEILHGHRVSPKSSYRLHLLMQIPRNVENHYILIALPKQHQFEQLGALIMHRVLPPAFYHQLRHQDGNSSVRVLLPHLKNILHNRRDDRPVGRLHGHKLRDSQACGLEWSHHISLPGCLQIAIPLTAMLTAIDVDSLNVIGKSQGESNSLFGNFAPAIKGYDHEEGQYSARLEWGIVLGLRVHPPIVLFHHSHEEDHEKDQQHG